MNLLFTDETGSEEIKSLLGFLDIDIDYLKLKPFVIMATNDIINLIGQETYDLSVDEYQKENNKDEAFIFAVRFPVAMQAYRKFAPHNDLSHTNSGRIARLEDNQKSPFPWQVDKSDDALERDYYTSLDSLIKFLDANIESWKNTDTYKSIHKLFISTASDFDDFFPIGNSRLLLLKLAPGIRRCENQEIKKRLGKTLFDALKDDDSTHEDLLYKVKEASVYYALAWAMRRLSVQLFPTGALQGYKSDRMNNKASKPAENNEAYQVATYFKIDADAVLIEIETMVSEINRPETEEVSKMSFNPNPNHKHLSL